MSRERRFRADVIAAIICVAIGVPIVYAGARAFAAGEERRREAPIRAILGNRAFEALSHGRSHPQHYLSHGEELTAPDFELPMRDGSTWRMADQRGKLVIINMWTVTCAPCMEEMPSLIQLSQMLEERDDIELVAISVDRDWETVASAIPEDSSLAVLLDPEREVVNEQLGTRQFPETWIIDRDGVIRLRVDGARDWSSALALDVLETYL